MQGSSHHLQHATCNLQQEIIPLALISTFGKLKQTSPLQPMHAQTRTFTATYKWQLCVKQDAATFYRLHVAYVK